MLDIWEFVHSDAAANTAQVLSAVATLALVLLTRSTINEMAAQRLESLRPRLLISFADPHYTDAEYIVENAGSGPALSVVATFRHKQLTPLVHRLGRINSGDQREVDLRPPELRNPFHLAASSAFDEEAIIELLCRDLDGRRWETRVSVFLSWKTVDDDEVRLDLGAKEGEHVWWQAGIEIGDVTTRQLENKSIQKSLPQFINGRLTSALARANFRRPG